MPRAWSQPGSFPMPIHAVWIAVDPTEMRCVVHTKQGLPVPLCQYTQLALCAICMRQADRKRAAVEKAFLGTLQLFVNVWSK
jgi:hypothetical protein